MAQGGLKVKAKNSKPSLSKKNAGAARSKAKNSGLSKKGSKVIAPKKASQLSVANLQKNIRKAINLNIENELAQRVIKVEEGKEFKFIKHDGQKQKQKKGKGKGKK